MEQIVTNKPQSPLNECLYTLKINDDQIKCLYQLKNHILDSGIIYSNILFWDLATKQLLTRLQGHIVSVECLVQIIDFRLASGAKDNKIKLWNTETFQCSATLIGHEGVVLFLSELIDSRLVSGSRDTTIKLWNINSHVCVSRTSPVYQFFVHTLNNNRLVSLSFDLIIKLWNVETKKVDTYIAPYHIFNLYIINNQILGFSNVKHSIFISIIKGREIKKIYVLEGHTSKVICISSVSSNKIISRQSI